VATQTNIAYAEKSTNPFSFTKVFQNPAPMLVPLIEEGEIVLARQFIKKYLNVFKNKKLDAFVLGCTHYPMFKNEFKKILSKNIELISQDEIIPKKLKEYLKKHPELSKKLSQKGTAKILVTDITKNVEKLSKKWFGKNTKPKLVELKKIM
jgi:glutamate racemase